MKACPKCGSTKITKKFPQMNIWICKKCGWEGTKPKEVSDKELEKIKKKERLEKKMKKLEKRMRRLGY